MVKRNLNKTEKKITIKQVERNEYNLEIIMKSLVYNKDLIKRTLLTTYKEKVGSLMARLENLRQECFLSIQYCDENFVSSYKSTMQANFAKLKLKPAQAYEYLGFDGRYASVLSMDIDRNKIKLLKNTADENQRKELRQVEFLFRDETTKRNNDT